MSADDALLEACRLAPDDDAPRLAWAEAVGGERGELVLLQCELARGRIALAEAVPRQRRVSELLAMHGAAWSGVDHLGARFEFRRGFVEAIEADARTFATHIDEIFRRAPLLRSLAAGLTVESGDPLSVLRELLESPAFRRLDGLHLGGIGIQPQEIQYG